METSVVWLERERIEVGVDGNGEIGNDEDEGGDRVEESKVLVGVGMERHEVPSEVGEEAQS